MGNLLLGIIIGVVGASVAWFFIAKNNKDKLLKAFATTNELASKLAKLPQNVKDTLKQSGINV